MTSSRKKRLAAAALVIETDAIRRASLRVVSLDCKSKSRQLLELMADG